jgi:uncharacterized lipoprotein YbaY
MDRRLKTVVMASLTLILAACQTTEAGPTATVRGEAMYRERIAAPPSAQLEALLLDVSRADAPSEKISGVTLTDIGPPPYRFEIAYRPDQIIASHSYVVQARLTHEGRLLFITDQAYPVITRGHPTEVQLMLKRVGAQPPASTSKCLLCSSPSLRLLDRVPSRGVTPQPRKAEMHAVLSAAQRAGEREQYR